MIARIAQHRSQMAAESEEARRRELIDQKHAAFSIGTYNRMGFGSVIIPLPFIPPTSLSSCIANMPVVYYGNMRKCIRRIRRTLYRISKRGQVGPVLCGAFVHIVLRTHTHTAQTYLHIDNNDDDDDGNSQISVVKISSRSGFSFDLCHTHTNNTTSGAAIYCVGVIDERTATLLR